jgi:hypothetical protein
MLKVGDRVRIRKGCAARRIYKGASARVVSIKPWERGTVRVVFQSLNGFGAGSNFAFFVHRNRLIDPVIRLHDNPMRSLEIERIVKLCDDCRTEHSNPPGPCPARENG